MISSILDIGANRGDWYRLVSKTFPDARYHLIEANPGCEPFLKETGEPYTIALLGDRERDEVPFWTIGSADTGASVYRELTNVYQDCKPTTMKQTTLDALFPNETFEFIKIDTQGSELDVIDGGLRLVSRARMMLLEVTTIPYNQDAPLIYEVLGRMRELGFLYCDAISLDTAHHQMDMMFYRDLPV